MLLDLSNPTFQEIEKKIEHAISDPTFCVVENLEINLSFNPHVDETIVMHIVGMREFAGKRIALNISNTRVSHSLVSHIVKIGSIRRIIAMNTGVTTFDAFQIVRSALTTPGRIDFEIDLRWSSIDRNELTSFCKDEKQVSISSHEQLPDKGANIRLRVSHQHPKTAGLAFYPLIREEWSLVQDVLLDVKMKEHVGFSWKDLVLGRTTEPEETADEVISYFPVRMLRAALAKALSYDGLHEDLPEIRLAKFGSCVNGFGSKSSDVDLVVCASDSRSEAWLLSQFSSVESQRKLAQDFLYFLRRLVSGDVNTELVQHARVPVLKLQQVLSGKIRRSVSVDITFMNTVCLLNSQMLKSYACLDESLFRLGHLVKAWARVNELISGPSNDHSFPTSYAWILMCIFFCQVRLSGCPTLLIRHGDAKATWGCKSSFFLDTECMDPLHVPTDPLLNLPRSPAHLFLMFLYFVLHEADSLGMDLRGEVTSVQEDLALTVVDPVEVTRIVTRNVEKDSWAHVKRIARLYIDRLESARSYTEFFATVLPFAV